MLEVLSDLKTELDRYAKLVDLDRQLSRLSAELTTRAAELVEREQQLHSVISDIKDRQAQLRQMDSSVRHEIERQHADLRKQLESENAAQIESLNAIKDEIHAAELQLLDIRNKTEDNRKMNIEIQESAAEEAAIYEELAGKVDGQHDLYNNYKSLIQNKKTIHDDLETDIAKLKEERDKTITVAKQDVAAARDKAEGEKRELASEIKDLEATRDSIQDDIAKSKQEDVERLRDLEDREETVMIRADALRVEREEFETSKRRHAAANRF